MITWRAPTNSAYQQRLPTAPTNSAYQQRLLRCALTVHPRCLAGLVHLVETFAIQIVVATKVTSLDAFEHIFLGIRSGCDSLV